MNAADQAVLDATAETDAALLAQLEAELDTLPRPRAAAWDLDGVGGDQWAIHLHEQRRAAEDAATERAAAEQSAVERARHAAAGWLAGAARAARGIVRRKATRARMRLHNSRRWAYAAYPLTDVDVAAVDALMSGRLPWTTHAEHAAPRPGGRRAGRVNEARVERYREYLTRQGERWLAVHVLLRNHPPAAVAAILRTSSRQIERFIARRALGWPTGPAAHLVPRDLTRYRPVGTSEWAWRLIGGATPGRGHEPTEPADDWVDPSTEDLDAIADIDLDELAA